MKNIGQLKNFLLHIILSSNLDPDRTQGRGAMTREEEKMENYL